jgi:hypothetical protein
LASFSRIRLLLGLSGAARRYHDFFLPPETARPTLPSPRPLRQTGSRMSGSGRAGISVWAYTARAFPRGRGVDAADVTAPLASGTVLPSVCTARRRSERVLRTCQMLLTTRFVRSGSTRPFRHTPPPSIACAGSSTRSAMPRRRWSGSSARSPSRSGRGCRPRSKTSNGRSWSCQPPWPGSRSPRPRRIRSPCCTSQASIRPTARCPHDDAISFPHGPGPPPVLHHRHDRHLECVRALAGHWSAHVWVAPGVTVAGLVPGATVTSIGYREPLSDRWVVTQLTLG